MQENERRPYSPWPAKQKEAAISLCNTTPVKQVAVMTGIPALTIKTWLVKSGKKSCSDTMCCETLRHREAFELYYSLGQERNVISVAKEFGISRKTAYKWNKTFQWQDRVRLRDIENGRRLEKKTNETITTIKINYRKIIKNAIDKWIENLNANIVDPNTVADLERLVKLDLLLMGEVTERSEQREENIDWREKLLTELDRIEVRADKEGTNTKS